MDADFLSEKLKINNILLTMGNYFHMITMNKQNEDKILMYGLDNSGKTTLLYRILLSDMITTIPTIGFNVENVKHNGYELRIWDIGGQEALRSLWPNYYSFTKAVIFVVDSSDRDRIEEAKSELNTLLNADTLQDAPFLIIANKQDLPGAMSSSEVEEELGLEEFKDRKLYVQRACGITCEGIYEGLDWIVSVCYTSPKISSFLMFILFLL